jgi:hypothetical protein
MIYYTYAYDLDVYSTGWHNYMLNCIQAFHAKEVKGNGTDNSSVHIWSILNKIVQRVGRNWNHSEYNLKLYSTASSVMS